VGEHFLIRLRIVHPIVASLVATAMMVLAAYYLSRTEEERLRTAVKWVLGLVALQVTLGVINVLLYAPGWMQLIHLLVADILWIAAVLLVVFEAEAAFLRGEEAQSSFGNTSAEVLGEG
jgi:heme A synthase